MWKIYQDKTVANDGFGNCFNACIASVLELRLCETAQIFPNTTGDWNQRWRDWLADKGFRLSTHFSVDDDDEDPPLGYSIAAVYTDRIYPEDHRKAGQKIAHAVVMFDGRLVHDPFPLGSNITQVLYYNKLVPLTEAEKALRKMQKWQREEQTKVENNQS